MKYFNKNDVKNIKSFNFDFIDLEEANHVFTVTLNRPKKKNALNPQMINEMAFAFQYASSNDDIRALLLKSNGDVFCSGLDLKTLNGDVEKNNSTVPKANSKILIAGNNFGCGSSREHAPWALLDFGITCVISSSYADIFYSNCFKNGILPIILEEEKIKELSEYSNRKEEISIDLNEQKIVYGNNEINFDIDPFKKQCLLEGLDDIALSLEKSKQMDIFEKNLKETKPWIFNDQS